MNSSQQVTLEKHQTANKVKEPLDNERSGRAPGLDLSLMNSSNADQASISLISPFGNLNLARLGRFLPRMGTPSLQSCPA
jgi:hypothetical protein